MVVAEAGARGQEREGYVGNISTPTWLEGSSGGGETPVIISNYRNFLQSPQELGSGAVLAKCVMRNKQPWEMLEGFSLSRIC